MSGSTSSSMGEGNVSRQQGDQNDAPHIEGDERGRGCLTFVSPRSVLENIIANLAAALIIGTAAALTALVLQSLIPDDEYPEEQFIKYMITFLSIAASSSIVVAIAFSVERRPARRIVRSARIIVSSCLIAVVALAVVRFEPWNWVLSGAMIRYPANGICESSSRGSVQSWDTQELDTFSWFSGSTSSSANAPRFSFFSTGETRNCRFLVASMDLRPGDFAGLVYDVQRQWGTFNASSLGFPKIRFYVRVIDGSAAFEVKFESPCANCTAGSPRPFQCVIFGLGADTEYTGQCKRQEIPDEAKRKWVRIELDIAPFFPNFLSRDIGLVVIGFPSFPPANRGIILFDNLRFE